MVKTTNNTVSYFSFTESPEDIKVWLTTYETINGVKGVASGGVLLPYLTTNNAQTSSRKGELVTIEASREHIFDQVMKLGGEWLA